MQAFTAVTRRAPLGVHFGRVVTGRACTGVAAGRAVSGQGNAILVLRRHLAGRESRTLRISRPGAVEPRVCHAVRLAGRNRGREHPRLVARLAGGRPARAGAGARVAERARARGRGGRLRGRLQHSRTRSSRGLLPGRAGYRPRAGARARRRAASRAGPRSGAVRMGACCPTTHPSSWRSSSDLRGSRARVSGARAARLPERGHVRAARDAHGRCGAVRRRPRARARDVRVRRSSTKRSRVRAAVRGAARRAARASTRARRAHRFDDRGLQHRPCRARAGRGRRGRHDGFGALRPARAARMSPAPGSSSPRPRPRCRSSRR